MTSAPADWVRWLILILISVIIAVAGQPVSSAAAASIVCAMAGAASRRPRGHDNWRLVMLPPSDDARRARISRRLQRLADVWSPGHDSAGGPQPDRPAPARPLSRRLPSSLPASKRSPDMKLPRHPRSPAPETAKPASASPGAPVLQVLIFSNTDLSEQEFNAQRGKIRRVANYDSHTRSWHNQIPLDRPEWAAEILSTLFEAARVHGTTIQVQAQPVCQGSPSRQAT
jgi:hypothetical protein